MLHFSAQVVKKSVEIAETAACFGHGVSDGGQAREFGVDKLIHNRDRGAFAYLLGGFLSFHERIDGSAEIWADVGGRSERVRP